MTDTDAMRSPVGALRPSFIVVHLAGHWYMGEAKADGPGYALARLTDEDDATDRLDILYRDRGGRG